MRVCVVWDCVKYEFVVECSVCWKKDVWEYTCDDIYIYIYSVDALVLW
jgi:hypothetical protein